MDGPFLSVVGHKNERKGKENDDQYPFPYDANPLHTLKDDKENNLNFPTSIENHHKSHAIRIPSDFQKRSIHYHDHLDIQYTY